MSNWFQVSNRGRSLFFSAPAFLLGFLSLINARLALGWLIAVLLFLLATAFMRDARVALPKKIDLVAVSFGVLVLYALASGLWAAQPSLTLSKTSAAALIAISGFFVINLLAREPDAHVRPMAFGLWIGVFLGLTLFLFEVTSGQAVKIWLVNAFHLSPNMLSGRFMEWNQGKLVAVDVRALNREVTPITVLIWPVLMAVQATLAKPWRTAAVTLLIGVAVVAVLLSRHATSIIAIVVGLCVFGAAYKARPAVFYALAVGWILCSLAVVPAAWIAYRLDLHDAPWLKESAQNRIVIWNNASDQVLKAPFIGRGANMYVLLARDLEPTIPHSRFENVPSIHPHNIFLQVWVELGLVGALLLMMTGLCVLRQISQLSARLQPYAYATMAALWMYFLAGYGLWQIWYLALVAYSAVVFTLGRRAMELTDATQTAVAVDNVASAQAAPPG